MSLLHIASTVMAMSVGGPHTGPQSARDDLLITRAPFPAGRVDSPARVQNGRLWVGRSPIGSRTPIAEQIVGDPGPASYGAPWSAADDVIYVRVNHVPVAINPWESLAHISGFQRLEAARNTWLREQGYVLKVRTHVNPRYTRADSRDMYAASTLPTPRATIRINDEASRRPSKMRVMTPVSSQPISRISVPHWAPAAGPATVVPSATPVASSDIE